MHTKLIVPKFRVVKEESQGIEIPVNGRESHGLMEASLQ